MPTKMNLNNGAKCAVTSRKPTKQASYSPFQSPEEMKSFYQAVADQESDLKNEAWAFLIHKKLYKEYLEWIKTNRTKLILSGIIKGIKVR